MISHEFQVWIRGHKVITLPTRSEADHWADLLGTDYAPATVKEATDE